MALKNEVKTTLTADDQTKKATDSAASNIKKLGNETKKSESIFKGVSKAIAGAFAVEKLLQFGKEAVRQASASNPQLAKSLDKVGDTFRGFQVAIGEAILSNQELMDGFTALIVDVGPIVIKSFMAILNTVLLVANGLKTLWQTAKLAFNAITGKDTSEQKLALAELGEESLKIQATYQKIFETSTQIKPISDPAKKDTKNIKEANDVLLERADLMLALSKETDLSVKEHFDLMNIQKQLNDAIKTGNLTLEKRIEYLKSVKDVSAALAGIPTPQIGLTKTGNEPKADPTLGLEGAAQQAATNMANISNIPLGQPVNEFLQGFEAGLGPLKEFVTLTESLEHSLGNLASTTLVNLSEGFVTAFEAVGGGANIFKSLEKSIKQSVAQAAAAEARIEAARGAAKIAAGIFPPNPAALLSGAKHFAAAAAFGAIAGVAGGSGGRGGGGTSSAIADRDRLVNTTNSVERGIVNITVKGDRYLDAGNPKVLEAIANGMNAAKDARLINWVLEP